ncbi:MAG: hypothetical protein GY786_14460, partial [Proteobacteria bacterium]|nr:hypothetical protein [Pseudomonadota bacterium]
KESAIRSNLQIPVKIKDQISVIQGRQSMHLDLVRCHYINSEGIPASCLVLNDILIGVPTSKLPLLLKAFVQWMKITSTLSLMKKQHKIKVKKDNQTVYDGNYLFSIVLLGNKITKGTLIHSKARVRQKSFEYIQFSTRPLKSYKSSLPQLLSGNIKDSNENLLHKQFDKLEIQGIGKDNELIADGIHIGRLPASFTLLPNAIEVISPRLLIPVKVSWGKKMSESAIPATVPQMPRKIL